MTVSGVEIPDDVEPVIDEPMVLNDAGTIGYSLNGKSFPATDPYVVNQGDWVSIHYYNEGLQIHPMHLHQFPQLVYAKDGMPTGRAVLGGHDQRRPRRALQRAVQSGRYREPGSGTAIS